MNGRSAAADGSGLGVPLAGDACVIISCLGWDNWAPLFNCQREGPMLMLPCFNIIIRIDNRDGGAKLPTNICDGDLGVGERYDGCDGCK